MQDRSPPTRQIFLLRTAGPYIGSKADIRHRQANVRLPPKADMVQHYVIENARLFEAEQQRTRAN